MNAAFATQGLNVRFHYRVAEALASRLPLERRGFFVSDSAFNRTFLEEVPAFASEPHVLSEWSLMQEAKTTAADPAWLRSRERRMNAGPLWDAFVCDRRVMQGRWCKERQDYKPRFTHDELLRILTVTLHRVEAWLDAIRPDVVFSLVPVTFGEYLIWMAARSRGIPTLFIYPTKILNYMCWMDSFFGRPEAIVGAFEEYQRTSRTDAWTERAEQYLGMVQGGEVRHEGMVAIPGTIAPAKQGPAITERLRAAGRVARAEWAYWTTAQREDNHLNPPIASLVRRTAVASLRRRRVQARLDSAYVRRAALAALDYAFYPLHAEPEVALSIQGKPYVNQIETMRNVARNLPAGMVLLTKEHPRSIGYHPPSYYEKLLEIPNLRIADPFIESRHIVDRAALVAVVWSFVGFEAILKRKPVLSLGTPPFGVLPPSMIRHVTDLNRLADAAREAIDGYQFDARALTHYVAACMKASVPLDFYAHYLEKRGRFMAELPGAGAGEQFSAFIDYTVRRVHEVSAVAAS